MKKILLLVLSLFLLTVAFVGCDAIAGNAGDCDHEGGSATCQVAAVCNKCGKSYGEKAAHDYNEATCLMPKLCKNCGTPDGEKLGHDLCEPTCEVGKVCKRCGSSFGSALEHQFGEASCTEPKTCSVCGATDGEKLGHDYADATCELPKTCKTCGVTEGEANGHKYGEVDCTHPKTCTVCGVTQGEPQHEYNKSYSYDENGHWIECSACGDKKSEGNHTGGVATTTAKAVCDVCNQPYGEEKKVVIDWKIEALTPAEGTVFCLANSRIKSWYESFDFRTTDTDAHWLEKDIFLPDSPIFTWSVGDAANYYKFYISMNEDMSSAQCYLTSTTSLSVEHLYTGTVYYWYVDAVYADYTVRSEVFSFATEATPRTVNIDGVSNARDIGGYITVDGKRIKQGMIYRSAKLDDITTLGEYTLLNILGVKTDLDLRGARTLDENGNPYMDPKNATAPVEELNHVTVAFPWYSTGENGIWYDDFNKEELAKAIKVFADIDNYPIVFHCSLGRDRTGTLAMILGGLLGLDENTLMMEYELSVFSYWGAYGSTKYNNGLRNSIHNTYLYIENNYEGDTFSEKVEDFLLEIGVSADEIASIKDIMLEEVE